MVVVVDELLLAQVVCGGVDGVVVAEPGLGRLEALLAVDPERTGEHGDAAHEDLVAGDPDVGVVARAVATRGVGPGEAAAGLGPGTASASSAPGRAAGGGGVGAAVGGIAAGSPAGS